jgi:protein TonB
MLRTLLESQATRTRRTGGTIFSIGMHTLVIGLAIVATARATSTPPHEPIETRTVVYTAPPAPPTPVERQPTIDGSTWLPIKPEGPLVPPVVIPTKVPPVDYGRALVTDTDFVMQCYDCGRPAGAGSNRALDDSRGRFFTLATVEKAAVPLAGNPAPTYPSALRGASIEGSVVARFVIDTTGRAEPQSITFLEATHPLFAEAVRQALLRSRYLPATIGNRPVRQLVEQRFGFTLRGR